MSIHTVPASEFKQKCLAIMEEISMTGETIIITKHGVPVCKLSPLSSHKGHPRFGWMKDSIKIHGDLTKPVNEKWEVNR